MIGCRTKQCHVFQWTKKPEDLVADVFCSSPPYSDVLKSFLNHSDITARYLSARLSANVFGPTIQDLFISSETSSSTQSRHQKATAVYLATKIAPCHGLPDQAARSKPLVSSLGHMSSDSCRRTHRKSRLGCKQCKQRHVKCDETHPVCINCSNTLRTCSFQDSSGARPSPQSFRVTSSVSESGSLATSPGDLAAREQESRGAARYFHIDQGSQTGYEADRVYRARHLELLYHLEHGMMAELSPWYPQIVPILELAILEAFKAPYLMDQMLALSAAHKSTLHRQTSEALRTDATELQTRALGNFNASNEAPDNPKAAFLFSSFLGQHLLFDTFSSQDSLSNFLDKFVQCLKIHQGVRSVIRKSWEDIEAMVQTAMREPAQAQLTTGVAITQPPVPLIDILDHSLIDSAAKNTYRAAAQTLHNMLEIPQSCLSQQVSAVLEWPLVVPVDFIDLVEQRRPEAIAILTYYAVLLLRTQSFWVVGNAGKFLILSVTENLGTYWAEWLQWPNEMLRQSEIDNKFL
ncbi:hypothetical protein NM208_g7265 [Fusarium decemcellulare]|uniref:Uncharacterized protein n=1 Tax=Fusarium decemcellulare TaxID=57161 RepID=A0ACC1SA16_9HYPO|nr:hypothetical protein NM208_g7265 [Fusarium decemcellulare]